MLATFKDFLFSFPGARAFFFLLFAAKIDINDRKKPSGTQGKFFIASHLEVEVEVLLTLFFSVRNPAVFFFTFGRREMSGRKKDNGDHTWHAKKYVMQTKHEIRSCIGAILTMSYLV